MRSPLTLTVILLLFAGAISAQEQKQETVTKGKSRMTIGFTGAYSVPLGQYKAIDSVAGTAGNAGGGFLAQLQLNWLGKKDFGLGISYIFQQNYPTDEAKTISPDGMPVGFVLGDNPWSNHYLLAGPVLVKEFNKLVLDISLLAGVVIAKTTNFSIWLPAVDSVSQPSVSSGAGFGFAFQARISVGYCISKRVILRADLSYLGGSPSRTKDYYYYYYVNDPIYGLIPVYQGAEVTIKKKISTFNPGIGLTIKL